MPRSRSTCGIVFVSLSLMGIFFCSPASAQSLEEMQTLQLFYKDKELVVSATRNPKPISQVAENITVVTAREIEEMNAHTVAEVLNRGNGLFVDFTKDFGAVSLINIQASEPRHVLVLLDGAPWNFLSEGSAETNSIPVGIIDRIEIIKGPASSAWGSSLGGVINIFTKDAGKTKRPTGQVKASYGERQTGDYSTQVAGLAGTVGYYLYAGRQESDGLRDDRGFDASSLFAKFNLSISQDVELGLTAGFSKPRNQLGAFASSDITSSSDARSFFLTASLDASLTEELDLTFSVHRVGHKNIIRTDTLGLGILFPSQGLFSDNSFDNETTGASAKLVWTKGRHTAVMGIDADRGTLEQTLNQGTLLQSFGLPATTVTQPAIDKWAFYANDTIALDRWPLTSGLRYDYNNIIASFVSPSLGVTYKVTENTLTRASVARGFTLPPLSATSGGGLFLSPNPFLTPESIWSYQAGLESAAIPHLWVKGTVFYHDLDNLLLRERGAAGPPTNNDLIVNHGNVRRKGLERTPKPFPFITSRSPPASPM